MEQTVHIKAGDLEVLTSGSAIAVPGKPLEFTLHGDGTPMILRMVFATDGNKGPSYKLNVINSHELEVTFFNSAEPLGTGNKQPIELGTFRERRMFFSYRIYGIQDAGNLVHYCWYLGAKAANG